MPSEKPNVLLIMADDVGWFDVGVYHRGLMGCQTRVLTGSPLGWSCSPTPTPSELHGREGGVDYRTAPDAYRFDPPRQAPPDFNPQAIVDVALKAAGQRGD
jgi:hypothetical protein